MPMGIFPRPIFKDRADAGRRLAAPLAHLAGRDDVIVLGLPRGGVPVAAEVAKELAAPLDVFLVRKLGVPGHRELAMGAIASGDVQVINSDVVRSLDIQSCVIDEVANQERQELRRLEEMYRDGHGALELRGQIVILVDDGLATGATMRAAIEGVRARRPSQLIVAVPVATSEVCDQLRPLTDEMLCLETPDDFWGVGAWYRDFGQTSDAEVQTALQEAAELSEH